MSETTLEKISWEEAFLEGERRIQAKFVDAMVNTHALDRARLLTHRESVKRKIEIALNERNSRKLKKAFQEQVKLLSRITPLVP